MGFSQPLAHYAARHKLRPSLGLFSYSLIKPKFLVSYLLFSLTLSLDIQLVKVTPSTATGRLGYDQYNQSMSSVYDYIHVTVPGLFILYSRCTGSY
jgi:hypothetical protein